MYQITTARIHLTNELPVTWFQKYFLLWRDALLGGALVTFVGQRNNKNTVKLRYHKVDGTV